MLYYFDGIKNCLSCGRFADMKSKRTAPRFHPQQAWETTVNKTAKILQRKFYNYAKFSTGIWQCIDFEIKKYQAGDILHCCLSWLAYRRAQRTFFVQVETIRLALQRSEQTCSHGVPIKTACLFLWGKSAERAAWPAEKTCKGKPLRQSVQLIARQVFRPLRAQKIDASRFAFVKKQFFEVKNAHGSLFFALGWIGLAPSLDIARM